MSDDVDPTVQSLSDDAERSRARMDNMQHAADGMQRGADDTHALMQTLNSSSKEGVALLSELRASIGELADRVLKLASALDVVADIQLSQQTLDQQTLAALEEARSARTMASRAENNVVPRDELDARNQADEKLRQYERKIFLRKVYAAVVVALLFCTALAAVAVSQHHAQQQTRQYVDTSNNLIYQSCLARNDQLDKQRALYRGLIEAEKQVADPRDKPRTDARIRSYQAVYDGTSPPVDCLQFRQVIH